MLILLTFSLRTSPQALEQRSLIVNPARGAAQAQPSALSRTAGAGAGRRPRERDGVEGVPRDEEAQGKVHLRPR